MNYFIVPPNAKIESVEYRGLLPARQGGSTLSLVIQYDQDLGIPSLPALFVFATGVWLMVESKELEPMEEKFCYYIEAKSLASLQDLAKMLLPQQPAASYSCDAQIVDSSERAVIEWWKLLEQHFQSPTTPIFSFNSRA